MTDRELLELAAKAAGIEVVGLANDMVAFHDYGDDALVMRNDKGGDSLWNPLVDDGDALRLAVNIGVQDGFWFDVEVTQKGYSGARGWCYIEPHGNDPYAATRRAVVRAAAEIGRMK